MRPRARNSIADYSCRTPPIYHRITCHMTHRFSAVVFPMLTALVFLVPSISQAEDTCKRRGDLDALYCDEDGNMTADAPKDPKKLKNPAVLMLSYSPQEDSVG